MNVLSLNTSEVRYPTPDPALVARCAKQALRAEVRAYPKPGLVSRIDSGSHRDMDISTFERSIAALTPYFTRLAQGGADHADMTSLRIIGIEAEAAMMAATGGINTHRGAIFGLGLLAAAAGAGASNLGLHVVQCWGRDILDGPIPLHSHGTKALRHYGAGGARAEAAAGFPGVYSIGLPALKRATHVRPFDPEAHQVHVLMTLMAHIEDTTLLHRGGMDGALWARAQAREFLEKGGIAPTDWRETVASVHHAFVERNLSPGGCADLLAMTLFVDEIQRSVLRSDVS